MTKSKNKYLFDITPNMCKVYCHLPWSKFNSISIRGVEILGHATAKVETFLKGSLDSITFTFNKNSNYGRKVYLRRECKTLLGIVNKLFVFKSFLTTPSNVLPLHLSRPFIEFSLKLKGMRLNLEIVFTLYYMAS